MVLQCVEARENGVCVSRCLDFFKKLNLRVCHFLSLLVVIIIIIVVILLLLGCMAALARCGLLLRTGVAWSVSLCLSVGHNREPCRSG